MALHLDKAPPKRETAEQPPCVLVGDPPCYEATMTSNSVRIRRSGVAVVALLAPAILLAQQPSFDGTWKLNLAKSHLSGSTYTFHKKPSGEWHYSGGGFEADFDLSGKEYTMPSGASIIGKENGPRSWELSFRMGGKPISRSQVTLKGNSLMWVSDVTSPDGKTVHQTSTDTRVSGGPGFAGKWKAGTPAGGATTMKITMQGTDGMTMETPEYQTEVKGSFDGRDIPVMQAGQASKFTNAFAKSGPNTVKVTTKLNGKPFAVDFYRLSADGKTLTDESTAVATGEKTKAVFDRE